jgi:predicted 3-demethylubiquinone-9 3-methyltransferase (glyoxalase superfamily)
MTNQETKTMKKNTICLWYDHDAEEAARFYARTFPEVMAKGGDGAKRAFEAMMKMQKIDVATIEAAVRGEPA